MSEHVSLVLHQPEETVECNFTAALEPYPGGSENNPITDYFFTTGSLVKNWTVPSSQVISVDLVGESQR